MAACAAVALTTMYLMPENRPGVPEQPLANAQDAPTGTATDTAARRVDWSTVEPGDVLLVHVEPFRETGHPYPLTLQVHSDGKVRFGDFFEADAQEKSIRQIEDQIIEALENKRIVSRKDTTVIKDADVRVILAAKPSIPMNERPIRPGDLLQVNVSFEHYLSEAAAEARLLQVNEDGTIRFSTKLPPVKAAGRTLLEIEKDLTTPILAQHVRCDGLVNVIFFIDGRRETKELAWPLAIPQPIPN
jgi:protein involved in polysaccharide export with SLBB domain